MNIRSCAFWLFDFLKGSPVRAQYKDIISKEDKDYLPNADLTKILEYAIAHVPFYCNIEKPILEKFPVMNKAVYKQNGMACFSNEYKDLTKLHKVSTSGSTGQPMVVYQNREKRDRVKADLIHAHEKFGWDLGRRYIFIRNWVSNYKQSRLKVFAQNVVPISIALFDDKKKMELYSFLCNHPETVLFGYASSVCDFMNYIRNEKLDGKKCRIRVIVCDSDELTKQNKVRLEEVFGCLVINRYDNEENGLIGITGKESDNFSVNYQGVYIELLEENTDVPVNPGQMGRVVITDLYNKAMPLIRYDTGDYAISDDRGVIKHLNEISGRQADSLISVNGTIVSSVAISGITEVFYGIEKYQIEQSSKGEFIFRYVGNLSDNEGRELLERLRNALGDDAIIAIKKVNFIEKGRNGKYKTIIGYR